MKRYLALSPDKESGIYLTRSSQMDYYLRFNYNIYEIDEDEEMTLIATPEEGYLIEKPVFPIGVTVSFGGK